LDKLNITMAPASRFLSLLPPHGLYLLLLALEDPPSTNLATPI
jgi:hypothetical protein